MLYHGLEYQSPAEVKASVKALDDKALCARVHLVREWPSVASSQFTNAYFAEAQRRGILEPA